MVMKVWREDAGRSLAAGGGCSASATTFNCGAASDISWALGGNTAPSRAEVGRLEDLVPHVDPRLQHAFLLKDVDQRSIGVEVGVVELGECAQVGLGQEIELIGADRRVFRNNRLVLVEVVIGQFGGGVDDLDHFLGNLRPLLEELQGQ